MNNYSIKESNLKLQKILRICEFPPWGLTLDGKVKLFNGPSRGTTNFNRQAIGRFKILDLTLALVN